MTALPTLQPILDELRQRFGAQIEDVNVPRSDEVYLQTNQGGLSALCALLYRKYQAELPGDREHLKELESRIDSLSR